MLSRFYGVIEKRCRDRINLLAAGSDLDDREVIYGAFTPEEIVKKVEDYVRALRGHDAEAAQKASQALDNAMDMPDDDDRLHLLAQLAKSMVPNILRDAKRHQKSSVRLYAVAPIATNRSVAAALKSDDREATQPAPSTAQGQVQPPPRDPDTTAQPTLKPADVDVVD